MALVFRNSATQRRISRAAIAAMTTTALLGTGMTVPMSFAEETVKEAVDVCKDKGGRKGVNGAAAIARNNGDGTVSVLYSGFPRNMDKAGLKINDGAVHFPQQDGGEAYEWSAGFMLLKSDYIKSGNFVVTAKLPELDPNKEGGYWLRVLGQGNSLCVPLSLEGEGVKGEAESLGFFGRNGKPVGLVSVHGLGFPDGAEVKATINGKPAQWRGGHGAPNTDTRKAEKGVFNGYLVGQIPAGTEGEVVVTDGTTSHTMKAVGQPAFIMKLSADQTEKAAINATVDATTALLPKGAKVTFVGVENTNFLSAPVNADDNGFATAKNVKIPNDPKLIGHTVTVKYEVDGKTHTYESDTRVGADITPIGAKKFQVTKQDITASPYQVALNPETNHLFVTRTGFALKENRSGLMKLDAKTLKVLKEVNPAKTADGKGTYDMFGIALDNKRDAVWVSNTLQGTVAVYKQSDLSLIKQFEPEEGHVRSLQVDEETGKAYLSDPVNGGSALRVYQYDGKEAKRLDDLATPEFTGAMELTMDKENRQLFAASRNEPKALRIDLATGKQTIFELGKEVAGATSVAHDSKRDRLYVAAQNTSNVAVVDAKENKVLQVIPVGAQNLGATYNPRTDRVYVIGRNSGTLAVINPETNKVEAQLPVGHHPNYIIPDADKGVYVVNKADQVVGGKSAEIYHITPAKVKLPGSSELPGSSGGSQGSGGSDSNVSGSSDFVKQPAGKAIIGIGATLGILAAIVGLFKHAVHARIIPANVLPQPLRALLGV